MQPAVPDLSIYLLSGRVTAKARPGYTHVGRGVDDAVAAEELGFRRVWLSERFDLKDAGILLGSIAARTTRLGVGTGALSAASRNPVVTASLGSTLQALHGPRFVLGLGRGVPMVAANGWDPKLLEVVRNHRRLRTMAGRNADQSFHRTELLDVAAALPDDLVHATAAIGSVAQCVDLLRRYREAGVDEIAVYGSTPQENAGVIAAWRAGTGSNT